MLTKTEKKLNEFVVYIKSHCEATDYEDSCLAKSFEAACRIFADKINSRSEDYWSPKDLAPYVMDAANLWEAN